MLAVSPTERSESVSGMSAGKLGQVNGCWCLRPLPLQSLPEATEAAWHGPEVFLPQALLRDPLKPESQPRRRKQVPLWERELSKQSLLQLGTFQSKELNEARSRGKAAVNWTGRVLETIT